MSAYDEDDEEEYDEEAIKEVIERALSGQRMAIEDFKNRLTSMLVTDLTLEHLQTLGEMISIIADGDWPGEAANYYQGVVSGIRTVREAAEPFHVPDVSK